MPITSKTNKNRHIKLFLYIMRGRRTYWITVVNFKKFLFLKWLVLFKAICDGGAFSTKYKLCNIFNTN